MVHLHFLNLLLHLLIIGSVQSFLFSHFIQCSSLRRISRRLLPCVASPSILALPPVFPSCCCVPCPRVHDPTGKERGAAGWGGARQLDTAAHLVPRLVLGVLTWPYLLHLVLLIHLWLTCCLSCRRGRWLHPNPFYLASLLSSFIHSFILFTHCLFFVIPSFQMVKENGETKDLEVDDVGEMYGREKWNGQRTRKTEKW